MSIDNTYGEKDLLIQIMQGDELSFRRLFDTYKSRLYTFAFYLTHSIHDAEEIVQDVFTKIWTSRNTLDTIDHPGKYLYTMARNRALNHLAKAGRDKRLANILWKNLTTEVVHSSEEKLYAKESRQLINQALSRLTEQQRSIFLLSREEGLTHEQISEKTGLSRSRINNILTQTLREIKDYLSRHAPSIALLFWLVHAESIFF